MPSIPWLSENSLQFPEIDSALDDPNGLLAVGGDLSPARLLEAYRQGIFPWYEDPQPILWWSPQPRAVLFPDKVYVNRTLRKQLKRERFRITADQCFGEVLDACAELSPKRPGTWITTKMRKAYKQLHELGWAHSIEVWQQGELVGGLYGLALGRMFFGESMFSHRSNGSKLALLGLCKQLQRWGFELIDCQVGNDYLYSMGAEDLARADFKSMLETFAQPTASDASHWTLDADLLDSYE